MSCQKLWLILVISYFSGHQYVRNQLYVYTVFIGKLLAYLNTARTNLRKHSVTKAQR
jgi:hypothetical protein